MASSLLVRLSMAAPATANDKALRIAELTCQGLNQREIAKEIGLAQQTVSYHLAKPDLKAIVNKIHDRLADKVIERAASNLEHAIEHYQDEPREVILKDAKGNEKDVRLVVDEQLREHGFKGTLRMLEAVGILASPAPSIFVQQIYNTQVNSFGDAAVQGILDRLSSTFSPPVEGEIIDYDEPAE